MRYSYTKALNELKEYAISLGFKTIRLDSEVGTYISWYQSTISIEKNVPVEVKVYLMLHELGHNELRKDDASYKKQLPLVHYAESVLEGKYMRRRGYKVSKLEEEFLAWVAGYALAERMGIKINDVKWHSLRTKCLSTYIRFFG
jgi:hypothetical protein